MTNRQGFTLIEVMVAVALAGFMVTALFTSLYQLNTAVNVTESIMTVHEKAARLQQLFERDLSGATTLLDNEPPKEKDKDLKSTTSGEKQDQDKEKKMKNQPRKKKKT